VAGFLYRSETDSYRNETVVEIVARARMKDEGFGVEPAFKVRFADGKTKVALSQELTPWYPV